MEIAEKEEIKKTTPVNPPPPLPTTVELCTQYVFAYTFHQEQQNRTPFCVLFFK